MSPETVGSLVTGRVSPQIGVQPLPITNAAVKALRPPLLMAALSMGSWLLVMSTYGATPKPVAARVTMGAAVPFAALTVRTPSGTSSTAAVAASVPLLGIRMIPPERGGYWLQSGLDLSFASRQRQLSTTTYRRELSGSSRRQGDDLRRSGPDSFFGAHRNPPAGTRAAGDHQGYDASRDSLAPAVPRR